MSSTIPFAVRIEPTDIARLSLARIEYLFARLMFQHANLFLVASAFSWLAFAQRTTGEGTDLAPSRLRGSELARSLVKRNCWVDVRGLRALT